MCSAVFDAYLAHCESRLRRDDMAAATVRSYRKILDCVWRPKIGHLIFSHVRYSRLSSPDRVLHSIIAFANTADGTIVVGIDDGTKHVRGLADPLKEADRLANLVSDNIVPRLVVNVEIVSWRSKQLLIAEAYPSSNRPYHLKSLGPQDGVFVRIGASNRKADAPLIRELARMVRNGQERHRRFCRVPRCSHENCG
jgi:hypothetical protein